MTQILTALEETDLGGECEPGPELASLDFLQISACVGELHHLGGIDVLRKCNY